MIMNIRLEVRNRDIVLRKSYNYESFSTEKKKRDVML